MAAQNPTSSTQMVSRTELIWLAIAILVGAILRFGYPGRIAIEHFDEGVYASNLWFGPDDDYAYPTRYLYAPPLLPAVIEWTMITASMCGIKPTGWIPMIPCLLAGLVTIPSMWWIGRQWFGPTAGLISAWIVATSDFHVSYSRAALTDVPVCLFILWAVYFASRAFVATANAVSETKAPNRKPAVGPTPWKEIILAGGFTGLAWWTKYNGWLPLAIALTGAVLWQLLQPGIRRQICRTLMCWTMIAVVASLIWSPVLWGLQRHNGYASVAANHKNYVVGFEGWIHSLTKQAEHIGLYENWCGAITEPFAMFQNAEGWPHRICTFMVPILLFLITVISLARGIPIDGTRPPPAGVCLLAAWFGGMTLATPFYYPYPRLVLPWLMATWLAVGLAVQQWRNHSKPKSENFPPLTSTAWQPGRIEWLIVVWLVTNSGGRSIAGTAHAWRDRSRLQVAVVETVRAIDANLGAPQSSKDGIVVYVLGEPAVVFSLRAEGLANVAAVQNLDFIGQRQPLPTYVILGKKTVQDEVVVKKFPKLARCKLLQNQRIRESHLVELDAQNPVRSPVSDLSTTEISLYRLPD